MYTDTEGIIFKQIKTVNGRRMVLLFSEKYGKISAGSSINEKGRSKSALAMRPFTYGKYEMFKNKDSYNINAAEVIKSYYRIGEDVEKYMSCSYVLEFTEKLVPEEIPATDLFRMILDFFEIIESRKQKYLTLILAYQIKALQLCGSMPNIDSCVFCGSKEDIVSFSIRDGGVVCSKCAAKIQNNNNYDRLIYKVNFDIVDILKYILGNPLKSFKNLALDDSHLKQLNVIVKDYLAFHLDIHDLKSESFLIE